MSLLVFYSPMSPTCVCVCARVCVCVCVCVRAFTLQQAMRRSRYPTLIALGYKVVWKTQLVRRRQPPAAPLYFRGKCRSMKSMRRIIILILFAPAAHLKSSGGDQNLIGGHPFPYAASFGDLQHGEKNNVSAWCLILCQWFPCLGRIPFTRVALDR